MGFFRRPLFPAHENRIFKKIILDFGVNRTPIQLFPERQAGMHPGYRSFRRFADDKVNFVRTDISNGNFIVLYKSSR
jgi:hypothetical protein